MSNSWFRQMNIGDPFPEVTFGSITTEQLARWAAAAADDYNTIHYDQRFAISQGLPDVIMQGPFKLSIMIRIFEEWIGKTGSIKKINCRYTDESVVIIEHSVI